MSENTNNDIITPVISEQTESARDVFLPSSRPDKLHALWENDPYEQRAVSYLQEIIKNGGKDWQKRLPNYTEIHEEISDIAITEMDVVKKLFSLFGQDNGWQSFLDDRQVKHTPKNAIKTLESITGFKVSMHPSELRYFRDLTEITAICEHVRLSTNPKTKGGVKNALLAEAIVESRSRKKALLPPSALVDIIDSPELFTDEYINAILLDTVTATVLEDGYIRDKAVVEAYSKPEQKVVKKTVELFPAKLTRIVSLITLGATLAQAIPAFGPATLAHASTSSELQNMTFEALGSPVIGENISISDVYWVSLESSYRKSLVEQYGLNPYPELVKIPKNENYLPISTIIQKAINQYTEQTGNVPYWQPASGYRDINYYRQQIAEQSSEVKDVIGLSLDKDSTFVESFFPKEAQDAVGASSSNTRSIYDFQIATVPNGLTERAEQFKQLHPDQDYAIAMQAYFAEIATFTEQKSKLLGQPVSSSEILTYVLEKNNGDLEKSIWDMALFFKYAARNHNTGGTFTADDPNLPESDWIGTYVLDEYTIGDASYNDLVKVAPQELSNCIAGGSAYCDKDKDKNNRIGAPYHVWNLTALLSILPPEMVSNAWAAKFAKDRVSEQGVVKIHTDYTAISNMIEVQKLLDQHSSAPENSTITAPDIQVTAYPMINVLPEDALVFGLAQAFPDLSFDDIPELVRNKLLSGQAIDASELSQIDDQTIKGKQYVYLRQLRFGDPSGNIMSSLATIDNSSNDPLSEDLLDKIIQTGTGKYEFEEHSIDSSVDGSMQQYAYALLYQSDLIPHLEDKELRMKIIAEAAKVPMFTPDGLKMIVSNTSESQIKEYLDANYPGWIQPGENLQTIKPSDGKTERLIASNNIALTPDGNILLFTPADGGTSIIQARSILDVRSVEALNSSILETDRYMLPANMLFDNDAERLEFVLDKLLSPSSQYWTLPENAVTTSSEGLISVSTSWLAQHGVSGDWNESDFVQLDPKSPQHVFVYAQNSTVNSAVIHNENKATLDIWSNMPESMWISAELTIDLKGHVIITNDPNFAGTIPENKSEILPEVDTKSLNSEAIKVNPNSQIELGEIGIDINNSELMNNLIKDGFAIGTDNSGKQYVVSIYTRANPGHLFGFNSEVDIIQSRWQGTRDVPINEGLLSSGEYEYLVVKSQLNSVYAQLVATTTDANLGEMRQLVESYVYINAFPPRNTEYDIPRNPELLGITTRDHLSEDFGDVILPSDQAPHMGTWDGTGWHSPEQIVSDFLASNKEEVTVVTLDGIYRIVRQNNDQYYILKDQLENLGKNFGGDTYESLQIDIARFAKYRPEMIDSYFPSDSQSIEAIHPVSVFSQPIGNKDEFTEMLSETTLSSSEVQNKAISQYESFVANNTLNEAYIPLQFSINYHVSRGYLYLTKNSAGAIDSYVVLPLSENWDGNEAEMIKATLSDVGSPSINGSQNPLYLPSIGYFNRNQDSSVFELGDDMENLTTTISELGLISKPDDLKKLVDQNIPITFDNGDILYNEKGSDGKPNYYLITDDNVAKVIEELGASEELLSRVTRTFYGEGAEYSILLKKDDLTASDLDSFLKDIGLEIDASDLVQGEDGKYYTTVSRDDKNVTHIYTVAVYASDSGTYYVSIVEQGDDLSSLGRTFAKDNSQIVDELNLEKYISTQ